MVKPKKLVSLGYLSKEVKKLKRAGKNIVLANGCFDLIHVGHIRYLREAKEKGDVLIVALNSDKSVQQIKGNRRPILSQIDRADIVASFEFVDFVIIFEEPTVAALLQILRPDIHCKGTDYSPETIPEKETVKKYGGEVSIVGDPKQHSSKDLINHILAKCSSHESNI